MVVYYQKIDLFKMSKKYALAHCIAADARMGGGIAVPFRETFKQQKEILRILSTKKEKDQIGIVVPLKFKTRWIYNLITKYDSSKKPAIENLFKSLIEMKKHMDENDVVYLAMPKIGAGIDGLPWSKIIIKICDLFDDKKYEVIVCVL